jgi:hypothetical protein
MDIVTDMKLQIWYLQKNLHYHFQGYFCNRLSAFITGWLTSLNVSASEFKIILIVGECILLRMYHK